jgi:hypothetical protein
MARHITPLRSEEIPEVGRFLTEGFGTPPVAAFAAPEVLAWKYFDPRGGPDVPRGFVARDDGRLVGFVGICTGTFHVAGDPGREVSTLHGADWFASKDAPNTGAYLMLRGHRQAETAYTLGGSGDARRMIAGGGYDRLADVPVFRKVLRPLYGLKEPGTGIAGRLLRAARDVVRSIGDRGRRPSIPVTLRRVESFGPEVDAILGRGEPGLLHSRRSPDTLNHYLRHPSGTLTGWLILAGDEPVGFAMLNIIPRGPTRVGKVVECFLEGCDPSLWHAAFVALTRELRGQGADLALACGSTSWAAEALRMAGYRELHRLGFWLRDKKRRLPREGPFHLTFLEADYAYTP